MKPDLPLNLPTEFETEMQRLGLTPGYEATQSSELFAWVDRHWMRRYVPSELLVIWGFNQNDIDVYLQHREVNRFRKRLPADRAFNGYRKSTHPKKAAVA